MSLGSDSPGLACDLIVSRTGPHPSGLVWNHHAHPMSRSPFTSTWPRAKGRQAQPPAPGPRTDPQGRGDSPAGVLFMVTVQTPVGGSSEELQATGLRSDWPCQRLESTGQARIGSPCGRCPERAVCVSDGRGRPSPSRLLLKMMSFPQQPRTRYWEHCPT